MKKRKIFSYLLLILCAVVVSLSCEKDDNTNPEDKTDVYSRTNVPEKIGVIPPKSLNSQTAGPIKKVLSDGSEAYRILTEEVNYIRHYMNDVEIEMMMLDAIYDDILNITGNSGGAVPANTLKITYTQEMEDYINNLYPGFDIKIAGNQEDVPALELTIYASDSEGGGYKYEVVYDKSYVLAYQENIEYTMTVKWSSDKNKVYIKRLKTLTMDIPPLPTVTTSSIISVYNALENTMTLDVTDKTTQDLSPNYSFDAYQISLKETGGANNEIYYDSRKFHVDEITEIVIDNKLSRADDNGGAVKIDFYNWAGATAYKETFDASGTILLQSSSTDGLVWTGDAIPDNFASYVLNTPNLALSGFTPATDKIYCFVIVQSGAPLYATDPVGFLSSIIGFIVYEKSANTNAITDSYSWESISSTKLYEYNNEYFERSYTVSEL